MVDLVRSMASQAVVFLFFFVMCSYGCDEMASFENDCIIGETYITKEAFGHNNFTGVKLVTEPNPSLLKSVGRRFCGFRIRGLDKIRDETPLYGRRVCTGNVTIEYTSFNTAKKDYPFCTVGFGEANCACFSYGCNSVFGTLYQALLRSFNLNEDEGLIPGNYSLRRIYDQKRNYRIGDCIVPMVETAYGYKRKEKYSSIAKLSNINVLRDLFKYLLDNYEKENQAMMPNQTYIEELNAIGAAKQPTTTEKPAELNYDLCLALVMANASNTEELKAIGTTQQSTTEQQPTTQFTSRMMVNESDIEATNTTGSDTRNETSDLNSTNLLVDLAEQVVEPMAISSSSSSETSTSNHKTESVLLGFGVGLVIGIMPTLFIAGYVIVRKKKQQKQVSSKDDTTEVENQSTGTNSEH